MKAQGQSSEVSLCELPNKLSPDAAAPPSAVTAGRGARGPPFLRPRACCFRGRGCDHGPQDTSEGLCWLILTPSSASTHLPKTVGTEPPVHRSRAGLSPGMIQRWRRGGPSLLFWGQQTFSAETSGSKRRRPCRPHSLCCNVLSSALVGRRPPTSTPTSKRRVPRKHDFLERGAGGPGPAKRFPSRGQRPGRSSPMWTAGCCRAESGSRAPG